MNRGVVFVPGCDEFGRVTRKEEILQVNIAQHNLLVAAFEGVQAAVGVFLEELEIAALYSILFACKSPKKRTAG